MAAQRQYEDVSAKYYIMGLSTRGRRWMWATGAELEDSAGKEVVVAEVMVMMVQVGNSGSYDSDRRNLCGGCGGYGGDDRQRVWRQRRGGGFDSVGDDSDCDLSISDCSGTSNGDGRNTSIIVRNRHGRK